MDDDYETSCVILEYGSYYCRIGFVGDEHPKFIFRSIIGFHHLDKNNYIIGDDVLQQNNNDYSIIYPIIDGIIIDVYYLELLIEYSYKLLKINTFDMDCLYIEKILMSPELREEITCVLFEKCNIPKLYVGVNSLLSLFSSGRTSGCLVNIGYESTTICIIDNFILTESIIQLDIGGKHITEYLTILIKEQYKDINITENDIEDIKTKYCYIPLNMNDEIKNINEISYSLSNNNSILLNDIRIKPLEILFNPKLLNINCIGISEAIFNVLNNAPVSLKRDICSNIVICGNTSLYPGLKERITNNLIELLPSIYNIKIISNPERGYSSWIGGSILGSLFTFESILLSKETYNKEGRYYITKKICKESYNNENPVKRSSTKKSARK